MEHIICCLIVTITVVAGQFDQLQIYIIPTKPDSDQASHCPDNGNTTRCTTLTELIVDAAKGPTTVRSGEEIIFRSGSHVVEGIKAQNISLLRITSSSLTMRGESSNVTILCLEQFYFEFVEAYEINISNITFINCSAHSSNDYTLNFTKQFGNVVLDRVQINNEVGSGLIVYAYGDVPMIGSTPPFKLNITNSIISTTSTGIHVDFYYLHSAYRIDVYIYNTYFSQSCLHFQHMDDSIINLYYDIVLKNISIENSACWSALTFRGPNRVVINATLQDVRMINNQSPYLLYANKTSSLRMTGRNSFHSNSGVVYLTNSLLLFTQANVDFINNVILTSHGIPILVSESRVVFENCFVIFESNKGIHCGGMTAKLRTQLIFKDSTTVCFKSNSGEKGGGLSLSDESVMRFTASNRTMLSFEHNEARKGGAIFVEDNGYINTFNRSLRTSLFEHIKGGDENTKLQFAANRAQIGGSNIYGGWVDFTVNKFGVTTYNANISTILMSASEHIASDPIRACLCTNGVVNCTISKYELEIFGHAFNLSIVAVGQRLTPVIEFVEATVQQRQEAMQTRIKEDHKVQIVQKNCTHLQYAILFPSDKETITISPLRKEYSPKFDPRLLQQLPEYDELFQQLSITLKIKSCPLGFTLHKTDHSCACLPSIASLGLQCDVIDYKVRRGKRQWVGTDKLHSIVNGQPAIIAHQYCPYDYCRTDPKSLLIRLEEPDELCAFNRTGVLCGSCKTNFSRVFGTTRCKQCLSNMAFVLTPIFLLSGLLLVIFLMVLNLTVSVGTINGLTFYANIVRAQHTTFFTGKASSSFLSLFIAWLNLDQGIETCLYDGLDDYIITWFQFLFPLYIWLIAAVMVVSSHYSTRISKLIGKNAVPVLATLFLISYTKILRFTIEVISFTTITYPDGYKKRVWLIDGNIDFLKGKHIPLFLVTVLFVLLSLPYTFILLTIQLIYKVSHYRVMFWVQRLKPFIDAYTGPYKSRHRYWTGLLLVARIVLLVTFSVNKENNLHVNLIAITSVSFLLLGWIGSFGWVYEKPLNNLLEAVFLANIGITSAAVSFNLVNKIESPAAIYISSSLSFAILVLIVLHHIQRRMLVTNLGSRLKIRFLNMVSVRRYVDDEPIDFEEREKSASLTTQKRGTTSTMMQPFNKVDKAYKSDELKESLLSY